MSHATASPGAQLWAKRYNGPANGNDVATSVAVSPSGGTVFVTGYSLGETSGDDYATVAYSAATGTKLWAKRYNGTGNGNDYAYSVAVSPSGGTVFVTGQSWGTGGATYYATIAYNATTGAQEWVKTHDTGSSVAEATSVAVSPDGGTVFVTGDVLDAGPSGYDYGTIAYNATTGAQLWLNTYNGPGNYNDVALSVAVSPSGGTVFVTGKSTGGASGYDYATIAYNAATGAQLWAKRYLGAGSGSDIAYSVAVSPSGGTVFVTGQSGNTSGYYDYATVAYNATTGAQQWAKRYNGPDDNVDGASSVAVSPTGSTVYVTGYSYGGSVTGYDYATVAYNATTGAQQWAMRYSGPGNGDDKASAVAVSPSGGTVFVAGYSTGTLSGQDYATVAYSG